MDAITLKAQIEATKTLIEEEPSILALRRHNLVRQPSGQVKDMGWVDLPERLRFFGTTQADARLISTPQGEVLQVQHVIVGMPDDDIQERDEFKIGNRKFRVVWVDPSTKAYETRAFVLEAV